MMLSEKSKALMKVSIRMMGKYTKNGIKYLAEAGPTKVLDATLSEPMPDRPDVEQNLRENRKEAERYLASLLGMM